MGHGKWVIEYRELLFHSTIFLTQWPIAFDGIIRRELILWAIPEKIQTKGVCVGGGGQGVEDMEFPGGVSKK